jgi:hypothetical protein
MRHRKSILEIQIKSRDETSARAKKTHFFIAFYFGYIFPSKMNGSLIQSVRTVWKNAPAVYECIDLKAKYAQDIIFFVPGKSFRFFYCCNCDFD